MWRAILTYLLLALLSVSAVRAEEEIEVDRIFDDWSAFMDAQDCWIGTFVDFGDDTRVGEVYYFVTFHRLTPEPRLSLSTGDDITFVGAPLVYANRVEFELAVEDNFAFPVENDEEKLFRAMLEGQSISVKLPVPSGLALSGVVSLLGFRDAYNFISNECDFNYNPGLSDRSGVEPA